MTSGRLQRGCGSAQVPAAWRCARKAGQGLRRSGAWKVQVGLGVNVASIGKPGRLDCSPAYADGVSADSCTPNPVSGLWARAFGLGCWLCVIGRAHQGLGGQVADQQARGHAQAVPAQPAPAPRGLSAVCCGPLLRQQQRVPTPSSWVSEFLTNLQGPTGARGFPEQGPRPRNQARRQLARLNAGWFGGWARYMLVLCHCRRPSLEVSHVTRFHQQTRPARPARRGSD